MKNGRCRKVRCGLIGAGWWATFAHIPALLDHPDAELVAIQKRSYGEAIKVAKDFGIPHIFTSAEELVAMDGLDAVVVSSSVNMHFEHAQAAFQKGLHVLVEKPMSTTLAQARELSRLAKDKERQLLISCPWHYTRHGREARALIRSGRLGEVRMISILMTNPVDKLIRGTDLTPTHGEPYMKPQPGTYSDPDVAGGGQIYTQVSHLAAYLTFLTDSRAKEVFARFHNDGSRLDIYDTLNIELHNGCIVSIASTGATSSHERKFEIRIYGTRAMLFLELWSGSMQVISLNGQLEGSYSDLAPFEIYPERAPATNLVDTVLDPAANLSPGFLGVAAMEVIEAACISARSGKNIAVKDLLSSSV